MIIGFAIIKRVNSNNLLICIRSALEFFKTVFLICIRTILELTQNYTLICFRSLYIMLLIQIL